VLHVQNFGRAPGVSTELYYRFGLRVLPWPNLPSRLSASITNKLVASGISAQDPTSQRFVNHAVLALAVEVFL
jgi:hypothetical protein